MMNRVKAVLFCVLFGCAQDGADGTDGESVEIEQIAAGSDCPAGGVRLSVANTDHVLCNGERGATGATGAIGAAGAVGTAGRDGQGGAQGTQGAAWVPQTVTSCSALTHLPISGVSANLVYNLVRFTDGSVIASCSASTTNLVSAGSTSFFAGWQNGAPAGACIVVSDASGQPTAGWWRFEVVSGRPRATYNDTETADDKAAYQFTEADCPTATRPN